MISDIMFADMMSADMMTSSGRRGVRFICMSLLKCQKFNVIFL